jgi:hypothetical protein
MTTASNLIVDHPSGADSLERLQQCADEYHRRKVGLSGLPGIAGREQGIGQLAADFIGHLGPGDMLLIGARAAKRGRTLFFNMLLDGFTLAGYGVALIPQEIGDSLALSLFQKFAGRDLHDMPGAEFSESRSRFVDFLESGDFQFPVVPSVSTLPARCKFRQRHLPLGAALDLVNALCESIASAERRVLMIDPFDFLLEDMREQVRVDFLRETCRIAKGHGCAVVATGNTYKRTGARCHKAWPRERLAEEAFHSSAVPYKACAVAVLRIEKGNEMVAAVDVFGDHRPWGSRDFRYQIDWESRNLRCMGVSQ